MATASEFQRGDPTASELLSPVLLEQENSLTFSSAFEREMKQAGL